jgi:RNA polymerase sigma-70 factor (ECF subfamily)
VDSLASEGIATSMGMPHQQAAVSADDEAQWVQAAMADPFKFAPIYEHYFPVIYRYIATRVSDRDEVEDLVSTIFLNALRGIKGYKGDAPFRAWLFTIAHNVLTDYRRHHLRSLLVRQSMEHIEIADAKPGPDTKVLQKDLFDRVGETVRSLPLSQQEVILLKFSFGLSNKEISGVLHKSNGAVKMLLFRATEAIRAELQR